MPRSASIERTKADMAGPTLRLRVLVDSPPAGVAFAVQRGKGQLLLPTTGSAECIQFDFELRVGEMLADGLPNFLGEFAQGTPLDRFVYLNSGTSAGQPGSPWSRRAKLKLRAIPINIIDKAIGHAKLVVEARLAGAMTDGSPVCASVNPHAITWRLANFTGDARPAAAAF